MVLCHFSHGWASPPAARMKGVPGLEKSQEGERKKEKVEKEKLEGVERTIVKDVSENLVNVLIAKRNPIASFQSVDKEGVFHVEKARVLQGKEGIIQGRIHEGHIINITKDDMAFYRRAVEGRDPKGVFGCHGFQSGSFRPILIYACRVFKFCGLEK